MKKEREGKIGQGGAGGGPFLLQQCHFHYFKCNILIIIILHAILMCVIYVARSRPQWCPVTSQPTCRPGLVDIRNVWGGHL